MSEKSLAIKYRPKTFEDVVSQGTTVTILKNQIKNKTFKNALLFTGPPGVGKAQPLDSLILTPKGFIKMGDVKIGQEVFTASGNIGRVDGIYPQGKRPIYEITLQDRTKIRVSDEHLNIVYRYNQNRKVREDFCLTTKELISLFTTSRFKIRVDTPRVKFEEQPVPIDPYLLGVLIGDGSLHGNFSLSNTERDIKERVDSILRNDFKMCLKNINKKDSSIVYIDSSNYIVFYKDKKFYSLVEFCRYINKYGYNITPSLMKKLYEGKYSKRFGKLAGDLTIIRTDKKLFTESLSTLKQQLKDFNLLVTSIEKHIPQVYLFNSYENRIKLLQGLFDSDGYIGANGGTIFSTSSRQLSEDFAFLVRSLGIRDTIVKRTGLYTNQYGEKLECNLSYDHVLSIPNDIEFCTSKKHLGRRKNRQHPALRNIVNIEYIGDMECQCIHIDHEDHTYISDGFIPTHNTTMARIFSSQINGEVLEIDSASNNGVNDIRDIITQAKKHSLIGDYKVIIFDEAHCITPAAWSAFLITLEEPPANTIFIFCTTDPQKIPDTILSRIQRFNFTKISDIEIKKRIEYIIEKEISEGNQIEYEDSALELISKLCKGGLRDALTYLDKCLLLSNNITIKTVQEALNLVDYATIYNLLNSIVPEVNIENVNKIITDVYNQGYSLNSFIEQCINVCLDTIIYMTTKDANTIAIPVDFINIITDKNDYLKALNCLIRTQEKLKQSNSPKMTVLGELILC